MHVCVLRTGAELLIDRQHARLVAIFADEQCAQVQATWGIYQRIVAAYRHPDRTVGKAELRRTIDAVSNNVPELLTELITLGRTLKRRAADVLAHFGRPGSSNGPTEAINGRLDTSAAPPSDSATWPTTSPEHCWTPAASDLNYTLFCDEPLIHGTPRASSETPPARALELPADKPARHAQSQS